MAQSVAAHAIHAIDENEPEEDDPDDFDNDEDVNACPACGGVLAICDSTDCDALFCFACDHGEVCNSCYGAICGGCMREGKVCNDCYVAVCDTCITTTTCPSCYRRRCHTCLAKLGDCGSCGAKLCDTCEVYNPSSILECTHCLQRVCLKCTQQCVVCYDSICSYHFQELGEGLHWWSSVCYNCCDTVSISFPLLELGLVHSGALPAEVLEIILSFVVPGDAIMERRRFGSLSLHLSPLYSALHRHQLSAKDNFPIYALIEELVGVSRHHGVGGANPDGLRSLSLWGRGTVQAYAFLTEAAASESAAREQYNRDAARSRALFLESYQLRVNGEVIGEDGIVLR